MCEGISTGGNDEWEHVYIVHFGLRKIMEICLMESLKHFHSDEESHQSQIFTNTNSNSIAGVFILDKQLKRKVNLIRVLICFLR